MHILLTQNEYNTFIDVHFSDAIAALNKIREFLQKLVQEQSGLTVILWVDKSAIPGFIQTQFLTGFGTIDSLTGGVIIKDKESVILIEEWDRSISFPNFSPMELDQEGNKDGVLRISQNLKAMHETAKMDYPNNHTLIIGIDIPPNIFISTKSSLGRNTSMIGLMFQYPITRGFRTIQSTQLFQINTKRLPSASETSTKIQELWAKSAIPHEEVPIGIRQGVLSSANHWHFNPFQFQEKRGQYAISTLLLGSKYSQST